MTRALRKGQPCITASFDLGQSRAEAALAAARLVLTRRDDP